MPVLCDQSQQLSEPFHALRLHLPSIQQLPVVLYPVIILIPFRDIVLRRVAMILPNEVHQILQLGLPFLFQCHKSNVKVILRPFLRPENISTELPYSFQILHLTLNASQYDVANI